MLNATGTARRHSSVLVCPRALRALRDTNMRHLQACWLLSRETAEHGWLRQCEAEHAATAPTPTCPHIESSLARLARAILFPGCKGAGKAGCLAQVRTLARASARYKRTVSQFEHAQNDINGHI